MNHLQVNQQNQKKQRLPITLDLSEAEPVKTITPDFDLNLPDPLHNLFKSSFPALFENPKEVQHGK